MLKVGVSIWLLVFGTGFAILALEILGIKIVAPYIGTTLPVWSSLIGVTLLGGMIGYYEGGVLADRKGGDVLTLRVLSIGASILIVAIPFLREMIPSFATHISYTTGALLSSLLLFLSPTVLLSAITTYSIRMHATSMENIAQIHGDLYAMATAGSICGVFAVSNVLVPFYTIPHILYGLGVAILFLGFCVRPVNSAV